MGTICTLSDAQTNVPGFSALPAQQQTDLVNAATSSLNVACARILPLTQHDERHRPENTRSLRLKEYPLVDIVRVATGLATVLTIRCTDATASRATVKLTTTGQGDTLAVTGVSLMKTAGGVTTTTPLPFSTTS